MPLPFRSLLAAAGILLGAGSASSVRTAPPTVPHPAWSRHAVIYEVNVRQYTPEGTFTAFQKHLPRLQKLGVDILWIMPVQPIGVKNRKGPLGSYYSISDYTGFNPEFGTKAQFQAIVREAHRRGMHVILDWVANHSSFDNKWVGPHPEYYVHRADGSISNARDNEGHETDWTDVAELNYDDAGLRRAMIAAMRWWVDSTGIDGFRCDVAGGVPTDFWIEARKELSRRRPDLFWLAEAEDPQIHAAFDMTYGWELHHLLNEVAQGKQPTSALDSYFAKDSTTYNPDDYRMYFTSNHDENSWSGSEFERMGANNRPAFVIAATAIRGMPLVYSGQEAGLRKRLQFFQKDTIPWGDTTANTPFYRAMIALKHAEPELTNGARGGAEHRVATTGDRVYAFTRTLGRRTLLVATNFGDSTAHVSLAAVPAGPYTDWFLKGTVPVAARGTLDVPAHGYRVLVRR